MTPPKHPPIITTDLSQLETPGVVVEVDPEMAADLGAFEDAAVTEEDAWEANADLGADHEQ